jgi:hypothetical protein
MNYNKEYCKHNKKMILSKHTKIKILVNILKYKMYGIHKRIFYLKNVIEILIICY